MRGPVPVRACPGEGRSCEGLSGRGVVVVKTDFGQNRVWPKPSLAKPILAKPSLAGLWRLCLCVGVGVCVWCVWCVCVLCVLGVVQIFMDFRGCEIFSSCVCDPDVHGFSWVSFRFSWV